MDVLFEHPSVKLPIGTLLELLPRLQCRYYSISSSSKQSQTSVAITAVVLKYEAPDNTLSAREGVATTWLERSSLGSRVPLFVRSSAFHLPTNPLVPIIMIGPGTGIAPFMGFLEERAQISSLGTLVGTMILYTGCRHKLEDYIYQDQLENYLKVGVLSDLKVAFSRDQANKIYVQHRMWEDRTHLGELVVDRGAIIYVCGDAKRMARDVHRIIIQIVKDYRKCDDEVASTLVKELRKGGRYLEDVWT